MTNRGLKKFIALFLALFLIVAVIFSVGYISSHLHHDCTGADCSICLEIELCVSTIKAFALAVAVAVTFISIRFNAQAIGLLPQNKRGNTSLFALKVKLNN